MTYADKFGKLDWGYVILLLLCLTILTGNHITCKNQGTVRKRKTVCFALRQTIKVAKAWELLNLNQAGIYGPNNMDTHTDNC